MATTVNRYTQTQENIYKPRTLQELMLAPAYKRGKHDEMDASIAQYETQLAQADSLDVHGDKLKEEQQKLYDSMLAQRDKLESEGFSQSSKSDFIRFNKDYQQAIGPQGNIGKIDKARISYETEKENLLKNATTMGYGPKEVQDKLKKAYDKYKSDFEETGNITAFEAPLPPAYQDLQSDILKIGAAMKEETLTKLKQDGYEIGIDKGMYVIKTKTGEVIETSNDPNIQNAMTYLNNKWTAKGGQGTASADWQGLTPDVIKEQINSGLGLQRTFKNIDQRQNNYQFQSIPTPQEGENGENLNFIRNKIPGFNVTGIDPHSALLTLDKITNLQFVDGNIAVDNSSGVDANESYEEMVNKMRAVPGTGISFVFNDEDGLWYQNSPYQNKPSPILKQGHHLTPVLSKLRKDNPMLANLNDEDLVKRLQAFKANLASNYVTDVQLPGSSFEWYSDDLFGNLAGSGEKSAGTVIDKSITINGQQLTYDAVLKDLGYKESVSDFKTKGVPAINSYVPALGKFKGTVYNSDGEVENIFVEAPAEVTNSTAITTAAVTAMMKGQSFTKLDVASVPPGYAYYMVNDFLDSPKILLTNNLNATTASDLINVVPTISGSRVDVNNKTTTAILELKDVYSAEEMSLKSNPTYLALAGLDKTSK